MMVSLSRPNRLAPSAEDRAQHDARVLLGGDRRYAGRHHLVGAIQELRDVDPHDRGRHEPEVRERRVAPADVGPAGEDVPEPVDLGHLLQLRPGVGDGDEAAARLLASEALGGALEEVLLEDRGLERGARFARHDEQRRRRIDPALEGADLRRIGGVEHVQLGELRLPAEGPLQHLGAEARAAHAEEQNVREALGPRGFANAREPVQVRELAVGDPEPAEPLRLIAAGPQRRVARPEPPHLPVRLPVGERLLYCRLELRRQDAVEAPLDARGAGPATLRLDRRQQLAERVGEQLNAVGQQRVGRRLQRDAGLGQRTHRVAGAVEVLGEARARAPVIPERGRASGAGSC